MKITPRSLSLRTLALAHSAPDTGYQKCVQHHKHPTCPLKAKQCLQTRTTGETRGQRRASVRCCRAGCSTSARRPTGLCGNPKTTLRILPPMLRRQSATAQAAYRSRRQVLGARACTTTDAPGRPPVAAAYRNCIERDVSDCLYYIDLYFRVNIAGNAHEVKPGSMYDLTRSAFTASI